MRDHREGFAYSASKDSLLIIQLPRTSFVFLLQDHRCGALAIQKNSSVGSSNKALYAEGTHYHFTRDKVHCNG